MNYELLTLAPALGNHLWQSTAFATFAWLLTLACRRSQARVRHAIWLAASVKFLVPFSLLIATGNLLPRSKQPVAPVVYSAMVAAQEPFTFSTISVPKAPVHFATARERFKRALPLSLGALWLAGLAFVSLGWFNKWRVVSRGARHAVLLTETREVEILRGIECSSSDPLPIRLSTQRIEPGIIGIIRPMLVWPQGLSSQLSDLHIKCIIAHELTHVRRRDNLTALIHMVVESVFWFHPLVWWIERQMMKEREQACDEAVIAMGESPETYAESLLKTCWFCLDSALPCVSGVTGADLKRRVADILTGRTLLRLTWPTKLFLAAATVCAIAAPVLLGQAKGAQQVMLAAITALPGSLQSAPSDTRRGQNTPGPQAQVAGAEQTTNADDSALGPAFEVATIRPADGQNREWIGTRLDASGRFTASNAPLDFLASRAYVPEYGKATLSGGPDWVRHDEYDIDAKVDEAYMNGWDKLTDQQRWARVRPMLRTLLAQRFQLKLREEMQATPVYVLVQAKGGAKMKQVAAPAPQDNSPEAVLRRMTESRGGAIPGAIMCSNAKCVASAVRMKDALGQISGSSHADKILIDGTGLTGYYDFSFPLGVPADTDAMADIADALGLKFEPRTVPIKTYVITSAEKPSVDGAELGGAAPAVLVSMQQQAASHADVLTGNWQGTITSPAGSNRQGPRVLVKVTRQGAQGARETPE